MKIIEIVDNTEKKNITRVILEALPEWFGIEESREEYINQAENKKFYSAFKEDKPIGFLYLNQMGKDTMEIAVMAVLKEEHRQGVGKALLDLLKADLKECNVSFLQVKTVQKGRYENYDKTNEFYLSQGFKEFEVFPDLWDKWNPCQIYVMSL